MKFNGFWTNGTERIAINRTTKDGLIHYRVVDEKGKKLSKLHKAYAEEKLIRFIKEY
jgi:hypothetical protein